MNLIKIIEPRWHDNVVLLADWKIGEHNMVQIEYHTFPQPLYISGEKAKTYPLTVVKTKTGNNANMRAVPIGALEPMLEEL